MRSAFAVALVLTVATMLCVGSAQGQMPKQTPIDLEGTIVGMQGNLLAIQDKAGNTFQAEVTPSYAAPDGKIYTWDLSVNVTGKETPKILAPGMYVQFATTLAHKRTAVGEVKQLTLISLTPETRLGILSSDPVDAPGEENEKDEDEAKQNDNAAAAAAADEKDEKEETKRPSKFERCLIVGQITKVKNQLVTVVFPGAKGPQDVNLRLAADAEVELSLAGDLSLVRVGDKAHAQGFSLRLPHFYVRNITVEHSPIQDAKANTKRLREMARNPKEKGKEGEPDPFDLGDDSDATAQAAPPKPKVKLEVLKLN